MLKWLQDNPFKVTFAAFLVAGATVLAIALGYGASNFLHVWSHLQPGWIVLTAGAAMLGIPAYALAYRPIVRLKGGPTLRFALVLRVVAAGFGPHAPRGGFALDKRALYAVSDDERLARVRVLGLGALEWALLAPAAWICAVILLLTGAAYAQPSLLWPWAIAVPIGFAIGLWLAVPDRRARIECGDGRWRGPLSTALAGIGMLHLIARKFIPRGLLAVSGVALYWTCEIAAFYAALRFVGLRPGVVVTVLGYATGYALTRRSTPFGGAGTTEALLTFALHWLGQPVPAALAAVVVYRMFNFVLAAIPALMLHPRIKPLLDAAREGRTPARRERRYAAAPPRLRER